MKASNVKAMREAVEYASRVLAKWRQDAPFSAWNEYGEAIDRCRAALAAPARNCDRFHSYEQARSEWWKTEVMPRVYGVVSGAEKPFDEWLYAPTTKQKGETDGIK